MLKGPAHGDRKSTRLNSSHANISYAVFCLKKGEAEIGFYDDGLDLADIVREDGMLPMQRVGSEACKGIVPVCGKNRNETACYFFFEGDERRRALPTPHP